VFGIPGVDGAAGNQQVRRGARGEHRQEDATQAGMFHGAKSFT
jgi:hypothetical protein